MDWSGIATLWQKPPAFRAAVNILLAAILAAAGLAVSWGRVHPILVQPGWPGWMLSGFVVAVCVVAIAVATILIHAAVALWAAIRREVSRRQVAREAEREAARQAAETQEARTREEERLAALLPNFPPAHRAILARFAEESATHVLLNRADGYRGDPITSALVAAGFLVYSAPVDPVQSLYALHPSAVAPVRAYFAAARQAEAAARLAAVDTAVREADADARDLLMLFGQPNPSSTSEVPHPSLPYAVYGAADPLIRAGVLARPRDGTARQRGSQGVGAQPSTVPIALTDEGREAVERHVLGRPVARTRIDLRLDHIAGSAGSGSGARGSY